MSGHGSTGLNQVGTRPGPIYFRGLNKDPDLVFNGSEPSGNRRIGDPFTSLVLRKAGEIAVFILWYR